MKATLAEIKKPIEKEMEEFEIRFREAMRSKTPLLDKITHYIIKRKGKQMRPMFVFLSSKASGQITNATYTGASLIELLHTATLVHDDVVDDSNERRGFFSLNALWKNKIAVLVGDYLLSKGLLLSVDNKEFRLLHIVSDAVREMSEGELLQIEKARKLNITEEIYFEIIRQKTASLVAACCACGAAAAGANDTDVEKMRKFGELVGMAFQVKDDIFDYGTGEKIGKPTGIDIKERKMTLPLIFALNKSDRSLKRKMVNIVKNENENPKKVKEVVDFVIQSGGVQYAHKIMLDYKQKALEILHTFPETDARISLEKLVEFTVNREK
ncbi:MAG: polyprenyl synthetase family protein [Bacteroidota bacterium]